MYMTKTVAETLDRVRRIETKLTNFLSEGAGKSRADESYTLTQKGGWRITLKSQNTSMFTLKEILKGAKVPYGVEVDVYDHLAYLFTTHRRVVIPQTHREHLDVSPLNK